MVSIDDLRYPRLLKKIEQPPKRIYYKGKWKKSIFDNCLAVVGSRRMTVYGQLITRRLIRAMQGTGMTIVSGFMFGVDAAAHKAAIDSEVKTVAVMPCGIDMVHPAHQRHLYEQILKHSGLVISEFSGSFPPLRWTYPRRNRIVAGLSKAVLVVEAAKKSGSLITARLAREYGRQVFAVPGPLTSKVSEGTAQLISKGAAVVSQPQDILAYYGLSGCRPDKKIRDVLCGEFTPLEKKIVDILRREPMDIDSLARTTAYPVYAVSVALSSMQINGAIWEKHKKYYIKSV